MPALNPSSPILRCHDILLLLLMDRRKAVTVQHRRATNDCRVTYSKHNFASCLSLSLSADVFLCSYASPSRPSFLGPLPLLSFLGHEDCCSALTVREGEGEGETERGTREEPLVDGATLAERVTCPNSTLLVISDVLRSGGREKACSFSLSPLPFLLSLTLPRCPSQRQSERKASSNGAGGDS